MTSTTGLPCRRSQYRHPISCKVATDRRCSGVLRSLFHLRHLLSGM
jgi:hypothetical protein